MKRIILLVFAAVLLASCTSTLPCQFTKLADQVEKKGDSFSEAQWEKVSDQFDDLLEKYKADADKYNAEQKKEINSAIGRIQGAMLKAGIGKAAGAVDEVLDEAKGFFEGLGIGGGDKKE
jgi:hypothetical protein